MALTTDDKKLNILLNLICIFIAQIFMTSYQSQSEITNEVAHTAEINHIEVIENVIHSLEQGDSAMVSQLPEGGYLWKFNYGNVEVFVQLTGTSDEGNLRVWSLILNLPTKNEPLLMRTLLEMNSSSTFESRYCIIDNQIMVLGIHTLQELSASEVSRLITVVATVANNNCQALQSEFTSA